MASFARKMGFGIALSCVCFGFMGNRASVLAGDVKVAPAANVAASQSKPEAAPRQASDRVASEAFGAIKTAPQKSHPQSVGDYTRGCVIGAKQLPATGETWQAMRLSRNRTWGHPVLISYLEKLAADAHKLDGWPGLLVGDLGQPFGGPMATGHKSHQMGIDADIWFKPMPAHALSTKEREDISADSMIDDAAFSINSAVWGEAQLKLVKRAAASSHVARIFVHPLIKKALCEAADKDRGWLSKVRPWWGHHYHFHVRLKCPEGSPSCVSQPDTASDDGCGAELEGWLKKLKTLKQSTTPKPPEKPVMLSQFPQACQDLVKEAAKQAAQ